jgi:pimeloyl-ACP methyl ester carboxylesterase
MRSAAAVVATLIVMIAAPAAHAYDDAHVDHACPLPPHTAEYHFAKDFTPPFDAETQSRAFRAPEPDGGCGGKPWRVAGFGGASFRPEPGQKRIPGSHCRGSGGVPVIFVHGNNVDAGDWYPALHVFAQYGYTMCELWGLSYNGVGGNNGSALYTANPKGQAERGQDGDTTRITNDTVNLPDVERFVRAVLAYTGAKRYDIASHSLGVTLARKVLEDNPDLLARLDAFVGIAGGNHGTSLCQGWQPILATGSRHVLESCDELAPDEPGVWTNRWLAALNAGDETPGRTRYMTVYDGSGHGDPAYVGADAQDPRLEGATNCQFPGAYHNDLRVDPAIAAVYVRFLRGLPVHDLPPGRSEAAPQGGHCEAPSR